MKNNPCISAVFLVLLVLIVSGFASIETGISVPADQDPDRTIQSSGLLKSKLAFEENKGQILDQFGKQRPDVLFSGVSESMFFHIRNNGISYQLISQSPGSNRDALLKENRKGLATLKDLCSEQVTVFRTDVNWVGINPDFQVELGNVFTGYSNYYNVTNGAGPFLNVQKYEKVMFRNLWNGVDAVIFSREDHLEIDWLISKAENFRNIRFSVEGAGLFIDNNGNLIMQTPFGNITEGSPVAIQEGNSLPAKWVIEGNLVSLSIDGIINNKPLHIDPPIRLWGTYAGGSAVDEGYASTVDNLGNIYLAGYTRSVTGIATTGAHQVNISSVEDAMLIKFNPSGVRQWGTYYGDAGTEYGYACAADGSGNIILAGYTGSLNNIATVGSHQANKGGSSDGFLVKFDSNGIRQWATYYGGIFNEYIAACSIDGSGNIYIAGETSSYDNIATAGSHQPDTAGAYDAYLAKFTGSGIRLWGTYYGGESYDYGYGCSVDSSGNVYMAGSTRSFNDIATPGAHQVTTGGYFSAFLVKFDTSGIRQWCTYYGGTLMSEFSNGYSCAVDGTTGVFLTGITNASSDIATPGSHQAGLGGGWDAFLVKFDTNGVRQWGTCYGGSGLEKFSSCSVDASGNAYLSGETNSNNNIASPGAYQPANAGATDAFLAKFNSAGIRQWGTYYGGSGSETTNTCSPDGLGNVYLSGSTGSTADIATPGSHQSVFGGPSMDSYLVKFDGITTSIVEHLQPYSITIYPNPAFDKIWVESDHGKISMIEIFSSSGDKLFVNHVNSNSQRIQVDIKKLSAGSYIIQVNGVKSFKFVKN